MASQSAVEKYAYLEGIHIVREHDDLVPSLLVVVNEELARLKLFRIHEIEQHSFANILLEILCIKL
jgi:hypothetical protein